MDLLMAQFSQVALTVDDIKQVLGGDFWMWETKLKFKFDKEANGLYFNRKLRTEVIRRQLYTTSRKNNRTYEKDMSEHMTSHMETETGIESEVKNRSVFKTPTVEEVKTYCSERKNGVNAQKWHDFYTGKGWMVGKNKMKDWKAAVRTWEEEKKTGEHASNDTRDLWEKKASKTCTNCRGTGSVYAPGTGQYSRCGCVR